MANNSLHCIIVRDTHNGGARRSNGYNFSYKNNLQTSTQETLMPPRINYMSKRVLELPENTEIKKINNYFTSFVREGSKVFGSNIVLKGDVKQYNYGVIVEVQKSNNDINSVLLIDKKGYANAQEAFKSLSLDIKNYISEEENIKFEEAIKLKQPPFKGTLVLYDENKFYIIKDKIKDSWTLEAAIEDLELIKHDVFHMLPVQG